MTERQRYLISVAVQADKAGCQTRREMELHAAAICSEALLTGTAPGYVSMGRYLEALSTTAYRRFFADAWKALEERRYNAAWSARYRKEVAT